MRIFVCDDNVQFGNEFCGKIREYIASSDFYQDDFSLVFENDPKQVIPYLKSHDVDILFLDISMPEIDGFEIASYAAENTPETLLIFISNLEDRVFSAFKYRPFRFLRKSDYEKDLYAAIRDAVNELSMRYRCLTIKKYNEITPVRISRIIYAEKEPHANYVLIHCLGSTYRLRGTLPMLEASLSEFCFAKPSSSALINLEQIERISDHTVFLNGGNKYYIVSSKYLKSFSEKFMNYLRGK